MNTGPIVKMENVDRIYIQGEVEVKALNGLNLEIEPGEFTVICGPSGSGKSTTLNLIGALDSPTSGKVQVEGTDLANMSRAQLSKMRRDRIGFVFQAYNLVPVLTAYENAEFVMALQGVDEAIRKEKVMALLKEVGLEGLENRRPSQMSGGQQQRVAIARALANDPPILIGDEITGELDSETGFEVMEIVVQLNRERGTTIVYVTHDPRMSKFAGRLVQLRDGRITEDNATL